MPNLNLKGTNAPLAPGGGMRPGVRPAVDQGNKGIQPVLYGVGGVVVLAVLVFVLNATGVVHLWGKKATPPPAQMQTAATASLTTAPTDTQALVEPGKELAATTKKSERPSWNSNSSGYASSSVPKIPMTAGGKYSVQVSSWTTEQKARIQADVLTRAGFPAFVQKANVKGEGSYYRVYIGRYPSSVAAKNSAEKFAQMLESRYWVVRLQD